MSRARRPGMGTLAIASICAIVDVVGVCLVPIPHTVLACGIDWVLAYAVVVALFSAGAFPIGIVAVAVVLTVKVPALRLPWPWLGSAAVVVALAAVTLALAAQHPVYVSPGACSL